MANHLDLEEQEQLDSIKHFWKQYGNLITWALIAVLGAFASWNFYQYWQRTQAAQASAMYDEVERMTLGGDLSKVERAFADMRDNQRSLGLLKRRRTKVISQSRGCVWQAYSWIQKPTMKR
jgi:predicted negative regulator of RcsB-dependent stress response